MKLTVFFLFGGSKIGEGTEVPLLPIHPIHCSPTCPIGLGSYHTFNGNKIWKTHGGKKKSVKSCDF